MSFKEVFSTGLNESYSAIASDLGEAPEILGSISSTAYVLLANESPTITDIAQAAATDVGRTARKVSVNVASELAVKSAVRRGASAGAAKLMGGSAGGVVSVGWTLGSLAFKKDRSRNDVVKGLINAVAIGAISVTCTPLVGGVLSTALTPIINNAVDSLWDNS